MDNPEKLVTHWTQDEENSEGAINTGKSRETGNIWYARHKTKRILKGQSTLDNPEKLVTHCTQDEEKQNKEGAINTGQSRETGNTLYTRRGKTKQTHNTIYVRYHYA